MATQKQFASSNPFSSDNNTKMRRNSIAKPPPRPPSAPPPSGDQSRQQLFQYQNMYKQTKNQLEILKVQYRRIEKELSTFKSQKHLIDQSHSNIVNWQKKIANLEMENQTLIDKNGLFLQQKNQYLLQLADAQQLSDEQRIQIESKSAEIETLENEMTKSSQTYNQQLSKKDDKYKHLKTEYNALNNEYIEKKNKNKKMAQELNEMTLKYKETKQQNLLISDKCNKIQIEYDELKSKHSDLSTQICFVFYTQFREKYDVVYMCFYVAQVKDNSSIAVQLAQKKDKSIIKDLRQTLKSETMKLQQVRAEYKQQKDELNDLRDWREHYLRQQKLQQTQCENDDHQNEVKVNEDISDNVSTTSSASNHTASSKNSRNSITIKNKIKIMKKKSVSAISNVKMPSFHNLLSQEFGAEDEKIQYVQPQNVQNNVSMMDIQEMTKEHDEVIIALSDKYRICKENYVNLKQTLNEKDEEIKALNVELEKKKEFLSDLIEKLNDKPLPPTPIELAKEEITKKYAKERRQMNRDGDKVLLSLQQQGMMDMNVRRPPVPINAPPLSPLLNVQAMQFNHTLSKPCPNVIVSPNYDKGIDHNVYFGNNDHEMKGITKDKMEKKQTMVAALTNDMLTMEDEYGI